MRSLRRPASPLDGALDAARTFLARRSVEAGGLVLVGGAAALVAALATWSVDDPSLNHATDAPVRNVLGWGGAVAADLAMQLLGLGTLALVLPPALWGLRLLHTRRLDRPVLRALLWLAGSGAAAAVASALPPTARWPLPTGLGGLVGDALLRGTRALLGIASSPAGALVGFAFAGVAVLGLTAACGLGFHPVEAADDEDEPAAGREDDEPGFAIVSLGALAHAAMSVRASLRRRYDSWVAARTAERYALAYPGPSPTVAARRAFADEPVERASPAGARREPVFDAAPGPSPAPPAPRRAPVLHDEADEEESELPAPPPASEAPRSRVETPAPQPRPMKHVVREVLPAEREDYEPPALALLAEPRRQGPVATVSEDALEQNATLLESTLEDFGVRGSIVSVRPGPVVTLYELEPAPGTKSARVIGLSDDIARSMAAVSARVAVVQGRNAIGIELPNARRETVYLRELLAHPDFATTPHRLALALGKTIGGEPVVADLARMPHLLVAGTTGSGKSVAINTMILSLLYRLPPEACRLIMVDPKMLELSVYDGIPHLLSPVVTDPKKAVVALKWAVREMEERYKKMSKLSVRNIDGFNARLAEARAKGEVITRTVQTGFDRSTGAAVYEEEVMELTALPYIVIIVDEMADLMMVAGKDIEGAIQRLAQMARAAGIHLIMATQRPSVDVITGTIKANFPTRISFQVTSKIDSRTILGEMGAEQLLGQGDMLYMAGGGRVTRVHGPFCSDGEVEAVVAHLKRQGRPAYLDAVTQDDETGAAGSSGVGGSGTGAAGGEADAPVFDAGSFGSETGSEADLYEGAVAVVLRDRKASTSYIQRRLQIGYNRAASLMERMENEGIVGPANHAGKRDILVPEDEA